MAKIRISKRDIASLEDFAPGVTGLRLLFVNLFGVVDSGGWVLVDAGVAGQADRIREWAEERFGTPSRPDCIVLTHGHFDHIGAIEDLLEEWDVPVYAHPSEMPYLTGVSSYPAPNPSAGGGLMARLSWLYPRGPIDLGPRVRPLPPDGSIPNLPGWRWIHTPGHTEGHISLVREQDRVLLAGDAFTTVKQESFLAVATQRPEMHGPPAYYTPDWEAARDSIFRLAELRPSALASGHGLPVVGKKAAGQLMELARRFDEIAIPADRR